MDKVSHLKHRKGTDSHVNARQRSLEGVRGGCCLDRSPPRQILEEGKVEAAGGSGLQRSEGSRLRVVVIGLRSGSQSRLVTLGPSVARDVHSKKAGEAELREPLQVRKVGGARSEAEDSVPCQFLEARLETGPKVGALELLVRLQWGHRSSR